MLEIVTFTGVDGDTDLKDLVVLHSMYPKAEFGVLVGSHTQQDYSRERWPSFDVIRGIKAVSEIHGIPLALHLCGRWARDVMLPDGPPSNVWRLCRGFKRVQVNLHGDEYDPSPLKPDSARLTDFAAELSPLVETVIIQHRGSWDELPFTHPRVEWLFDRSEGAGRWALDEWPDPPALPSLGKPIPRWGYSGGIGPQNIEEVMPFVRRFPGHRLWLDMENNVRDRGSFSLHKCEQVCNEAFGAAQPERRR